MATHSRPQGYRSALSLVVIVALGCGGGDGIVVKNPPTQLAMTIAPATATVSVGGSTTFAVSISGGSPTPTLASCASSAPSVATVAQAGSSCIATGVATGSATVIATASTGASALAVITVAPLPSALTDFTLTPAAASLKEGEILPLVATPIIPAGVSVTVTYQTSSQAVLLVSNTGVVTAVSPGTATITATALATGAGFAAASLAKASTITVTARDVEAELSSLYRDVVGYTTGGLGGSTGIHPAMMVMAFENASTRMNEGMGPLSDLPRGAVINTTGSPFTNASVSTYQGLQRIARTANEITGIVTRPSFTSGVAGTDARLRAWSHFIVGLSIGHLALAYDSVSVPTQGVSANQVTPLRSYSEAMKRALDVLDSAATVAATPVAAATGGFPAPLAWFNGSSVTAPEFVRVVRSYQARLRAAVARTPAERAAVDWSRIVTDAVAGITADFNLPLSGSAGWDYAWLGVHFVDASWHQMPPYIIGMADTSGAYDAWLATSRDQRSAILIRSPDLRFPAGETRSQQNAQVSNPATLYFRNRPVSEDLLPPSWRSSQYRHDRWSAFAAQGRVGPFPLITKAETDLLVAEARYRQNNIAAAVALINQYRVVRGGLPPITTFSISAVVPGGAACVPRVPQAPAFTASVCGSIWEALKWEKRMETAYVGWGLWYFDSRGWGDLPVGTAVHFPVPAPEMVARGGLPYTVGGVGMGSGASTSTYGFGSGVR